MTTRTPEELEEKLHYHFKNKELLITALTHSSYANESKTPTLYNERLEFLGDSVLSVVVANYLFHHSTRPEGELSRMRASLVSEDALFQFAQEIDLGSYLRLGRGEELGGGRCRPSVVSDAFEATIAALFLDGGIETARNFIGSVSSNTLPEGLKNYHIHDERENADDHIMMRLSFRGDVANEPIIAKLARDYNLEVSILYGTVDFIQGVSFGKLIIDVSGSDSNITAAFNHLHSLPIESEVLGYVSGNI